MDDDIFQSYQNAPDFNKCLLSIGSSIQKISQNVVSMRRMVNLIGSSQDSPEVRQKLQQLQHYTNGLARDTSQKLSNVLTEKPPSERRENQMAIDRLTEDLSSALTAMQEVQRTAVQKVRDEVNLRKESVAPAPLPPPGSKKPWTSFGGDQLIELTDQTQQQQQQQLEQIRRDEENIRLIQEQEEAIRRLEDDIVAVNDIFKNLSELVHDQSEVIDSIEANIEGTQTRVSQGTEQLRYANIYKQKILKKKTICFIIAFVFLLIMITLIIISAKN